MNKNIEQTDRIEAYLTGQLDAVQREAFEAQRRTDPAFDMAVVEHQVLLRQLSDYGKRKQLVADMNEIHDQLDIQSLSATAKPESAMIRHLWKKYRVNTAIAASVALITLCGTLLSTGYFSRSIATNYIDMRREINSIKRSQNALIKNINGKPSKGPANPGQFGGTGFALTSNGYIVTNYHVVKGADSVYVQNIEGESFKAKQIYINPSYDVAVLQIIDPSFKQMDPLPYTFKKSSSNVGEKVYTYGFPKDDLVYDEGYVSSRNGFAGDTIAYQISVPINPGNSGGPLLDSKGNVVGIINRKQTSVDGVAFAVKSNYLMQSIEAIPQDSLSASLELNKRNGLSGLSRPDQLRKLEPFIFMVKVY